MQIHHAVSGAVPKKRVVSTTKYAITDLTARGHSQCMGFPMAARVEINDGLRAARPQHSVRLVRAGAKQNLSHLLATAHAPGERG